MKLKVFISQAMQGLSEEQILEKRNMIFEKFKSTVNECSSEHVDVELIDSYIEEDPPEGVNVPVWYLSKSIELLSTADVVVFESGVLGNTKNRGCRIEGLTCKYYGIPVLTGYDDNICITENTRNRLISILEKFKS